MLGRGNSQVGGQLERGALACASSSGRGPCVLSSRTAWSLSRVTAFSSTSWSHSFRSASWSLAAAWAKGGTQFTWGR